MRTRARGRAYIPYNNIEGGNERVRELGVRGLYKKGSSETIQAKQNLYKHVSEANSLLERD